MAHRFNRSVLCLAALLAACGSANEAFSPNPMFERWCNKHPCGWSVRGDAKQVGTWHPDDYAVELVGDDTSLSQLRAELDDTRATCFAFSLMAHVSDDAHAFLELDFLDDGAVEFSKRIPKSDWQVRTFKITTPTWYEGVRFSVRKEGPGTVIVAELNVELAQTGCTDTPLPLSNRPAGGKCGGDDECTSGSCRLLELSDGGTCD